MRSIHHVVRTSYLIYLLMIPLGCLFSLGCSRSVPRIVEANPQTYQAPPVSSQPADMPKLPAKLKEVEDTVNRVFKGAASIYENREPCFVAGDFNGDHSQDIAVMIKAANGKIAELNQEYPPWILKDPFAPHRLVSTNLRIEPDEVLLAIIHGYGADDWRDPQATQTFLLKNGAGSNMEVRLGKDFLAANVGKRIPRTQGDLIKEVVHGSSGYLYYAGPTYSWYDPNTFKGEPEMKLVHPGSTARSGK